MSPQINRFLQGAGNFKFKILGKRRRQGKVIQEGMKYLISVDVPIKQKDQEANTT